MEKTVCGADCASCGMREECCGCAAENGRQCFIERYIRLGGQERFDEFKETLIGEFNALRIPGMPKIEELHALCGKFVNQAYELPSGEEVRLLRDDAVYLGTQVESPYSSDRCFGLAAGLEFLLVSEYSRDGSNPILVLFKTR